ncbi:MAG: DUF255 domain-containing protein [Pirellulaceae bacterium]
MQFSSARLILVLLFAVTSTAKAADDIKWLYDFQQAQDIAAQEDRPLLVHFYSQDCIPCRNVENRVFSQSNVSRMINDFFVAVKIDAEAEPQIAKKFKVEQWPTDVLLSPEGREYHRMQTPPSPSQYVAQLTAVVYKAGFQPRTKSSISDQLADRAGVARTSDDASTYVTNQFANAASNTPDPGNSTDQRSREVINTYVSQNDPSEQTAVQKPPRTEPEQRYAIDSQYLNTNVQESVGPIGGRSVGNAEEEVASRGDRQRPPLGLEGHCPVTLVRDEQWRKGDAKFGAVHRGKLYLFVGDAQREDFMRNPDRYSPMLAGLDPVELIETGNVVEGRCAFGVTFKGNFYLFTSEQNLERFWESPDQFVMPIRQAMQSTDRSRTLR